MLKYNSVKLIMNQIAKTLCFNSLPRKYAIKYFTVSVFFAPHVLAQIVPFFSAEQFSLKRCTF